MIARFLSGDIRICGTFSADRMPRRLIGSIVAALTFGAALLAVAKPAVPVELGLQDAIASGIIVIAQADAVPSHPKLRVLRPPPIIVEEVRPQSEFKIADVVTEPDRPIALNIKMPVFHSTDYLLLSFRGMPEGFSLSSGFRNGDVWYASVHSIDELRLIPPKQFAGNFEMEVKLIGSKNVDPIGHSVQVAILPKNPSRTAQRETKQPPQEPVAQTLLFQTQQSNALSEPPEAKTEPKREVTGAEHRLLMRARALLNQNDIAGARLIYAHLARQGSVQGALIMAKTFDPIFLSQYDVRGMYPDLDEAKYWYGVAVKMGSDDASESLAALEATVRH